MIGSKKLNLGRSIQKHRTPNPALGCDNRDRIEHVKNSIFSESGQLESINRPKRMGSINCRKRLTADSKRRASTGRISEETSNVYRTHAVRAQRRDGGTAPEILGLSFNCAAKLVRRIRNLQHHHRHSNSHPCYATWCVGQAETVAQNNRVELRRVVLKTHSQSI